MYKTNAFQRHVGIGWTSWYNIIGVSFEVKGFSKCMLSFTILQLDPQTVWLKQEFGRRCYFPDQSGQFNEVGNSVFGLSVEGAPVNQTTQTIPCATPATNPSPPFYKPSGSKKDITFNAKVVKANMNKFPNGKVEFERLEQTHISINDCSANVWPMPFNQSGELIISLLLGMAWR